jgi:dimethylhistidine N-methyltransferase
MQATARAAAARSNAGAPGPETAITAEEVRRDLTGSPKQLQSKYLYDALGSSLFEAICRLPWYRVTCAETRLLREYRDAIVGAMGDPLTFIELGCGSGEKLALLAESLLRSGRGARVHLIDVSAAALEQSARTLGRLSHVSVVGHRLTYEAGLRRAVTLRARGHFALVLLLGSNIGNFDPPAAHGFLVEIRRTLRPGDALLLGVDLVKPERELIAAYDDPLGVTAAFNKNLLVRLNRELGADFDLDAFDHRAIWNAPASRIEMHLVSRVVQRVRVPGAGCTVDFESGESIWTESSYKFEPEQVVSLGTNARFVNEGQWIDHAARFALTLFRAQ